MWLGETFALINPHLPCLRHKQIISPFFAVRSFVSASPLYTFTHLQSFPSSPHLSHLCQFLSSFCGSSTFPSSSPFLPIVFLSISSRSAACGGCEFQWARDFNPLHNSSVPSWQLLTPPLPFFPLRIVKFRLCKCQCYSVLRLASSFSIPSNKLLYCLQFSWQWPLSLPLFLPFRPIAPSSSSPTFGVFHHNSSNLLNLCAKHPTIS